ncbi:MAG: hypothetical protein IPJ03_22460 [Ignavibacteriales bacterium]|nr:hypothetical protein [Ignavibacteriales bacterium]
MNKTLVKIGKFFFHNKVLFQAIQFLGMCILSVGSYALFGYIAHREEFYKWSNDVGMALNTAIVFTVIGFTILLITIYIRSLESRIDNLEKFI